MKDQTRTNKKLIEENVLLKQRIHDLEQSELERKKVEEALRKSEETLKLITDNMSDMIRLIDLQGTNLYVSPSHLTVLGYNPGDKDGKFTLDFIHPEDIENVSKVFFEGLAKTQPERVECRVKHANGHYVWIESVGDFLRNDKGEVTSVVMTSREITERKRAEEALRESEELSRSYLENAPDGIYMNDLEGTFLYGNRKCEEITGYRREEAIGKNFIELNLLPENSLNKAVQLLQANMEGKSTGPDEIELIRKGGRIIPIEINTNVIQRMGQRVVLATVHDITNRKRAENEIQRNYDTQGAINFLLRLSLENTPLEEMLKQALDLVLSIPWLALETEGGIFLVDDDPGVLVMKAQNNLKEPIRMLCARVPFGKCLCGRAASTKRIAFADHIDERHEVSYEGMAPHGHYCVPILLSGNTIGVINLYLKDGHSHVGREEEFLDSVANTLAGIIKRKQAEDALRESEERFRRISSMTSDIAYSCMAAEDGNFSIDWMTGPTERISGYSIEEIKAQGCWSFLVVEEDQSLFEENVSNLTSGSHGSCELRIRHKKGGIVWVALYTECVTVSEMPVRFILYGGLVDITDRKRAEEELQANKAQLSNALEMAHLGHWEYDVASDLFTFNDQFYKIFRTTVEQVGGYTMRSAEYAHRFVHPDDMEVVREETRKAIETTDPLFNQQIEHRTLYTDGTVGYISVRFLIVKNSHGRTVKTYGVNQDITARKRAEETMKETLERLRKSFGTTIQVMVSAIEVRDPYTAGHQIRSTDLARAIATEMGLPQNTIEAIRMAGPIHDIGKLSIPAEILSKPTKLTNIEFSLIKEHAQKGYEILKDVESPWPLAEIVYQHHERMDGSGYPRNLKGDDILMEARILAVADVVEAIASHRPYRPALGLNAALEEIEKNKGTLYDADAVVACLRLFREKGFQLAGVRL